MSLNKADTRLNTNLLWFEIYYLQKTKKDVRLDFTKQIIEAQQLEV